MLTSGYYLQQYKILDVLGVGGFSVTYLAVDEKLERKYAIKEYCPEEFAFREGATVRPREQKSDDFNWGLDRFVQEARVLAKFNHPNIVGVNQIIEANNTAYIVLEYQSGRSLKDFFAEIDGAPTQQELDDLLTPILNALSAIHRNNLLHRDIAPDNIYIRDDGSPVLLDFGSARDSLTSRSKTISAIVKSGYSPPEQYSSKGSGQGPWTDIYALAATIYQAVSGKAPEEATERLLNDELRPLQDVARGDYRQTFLDAVDRALKIQPKERPQTVEEWRAELLADGKVSASTASPNMATTDAVPEATGTVRSNKNIPKFIIVAGALGLAIFVLIGQFNQSKLASSPDQQTQKAPTEQSNSGVQQKQLPQGSSQPKQVETVKADQNNQVPTQRPFLNLAQADLCKNALTFDKIDWVRGSNYWKVYVDEAINRGLTVEACRKSSGLVTSPETPSSRRFSNLSSDTICRVALSSDKNSWDMQFEAHVREAKLRNLTLESCRETLGIVYQPENLLPRPYSSLLQADLCKNVLNLYKTDWETGSAYKLYVDEAKSRGLTVEVCRQTLGLLAKADQNSQVPAQRSYSNLPQADLCKNALNLYKTDWEAGSAYKLYVDEANIRGLTVARCRISLEQNSNSQVNTNSPNIPSKGRTYSNLSSLTICQKSLSPSLDKLNSDSYSKPFLDEFKARSLSIADCINIIEASERQIATQNTN